jgi:glycine/D-amino acid oxidase-like deaminating enzyme
MNDPIDTDIRDLRSGSTPWGRNLVPLPRRALGGDARADVVIVGGGITGAMTAEAITRAGRSVLVVDRAVPGQGSTAASTAMLLWEIDRTLGELCDFYGFAKGQALYRRSLAAATDLGRLVAELRVPCEFSERPSLYLAGTGEDGDELAAEHRLRERADLPGAFLDRGALRDRFGIDRAAALVSPGSAEADPLCLARGMLAVAVARGAGLIDDEVVGYDPTDKGVTLELAGGATVEAGHVVLATGYAMPDFLQPPIHRITSTWCLETRPHEPAALWPERALIWEAGHPYAYARTVADGAILIGGEDEATGDATAREKLAPDKTARLRRKLAEIWPGADTHPAYAWSADFGETDDGLPLIGRVPGAPRLLAAYGYGGNGITFSYMASRILAALLDGETRPWFDDFALDRPSPIGAG